MPNQEFYLRSECISSKSGGGKPPYLSRNIASVNALRRLKIKKNLSVCMILGALDRSRVVKLKIFPDGRFSGRGHTTINLASAYSFKSGIVVCP